MAQRLRAAKATAKAVPASSEGLERLRAILREYRKVVLAYSGGADSHLLLAVLCEDPDRQVLAVTARSPAYPESQIEEARELVRKFPRATHREIETDEIHLAGFRNNPPERCYFCKRELFSTLEKIRQVEGYDILMDGSNLDDLSDFRPGLRALEELGVRSPLKEAGIGKEEIRRLSRAMGLSTWNKPSFACLSSRFPYGTPITEEALARIERCEAFLADRMHGPIRVRYYESLARIEVDPKVFPMLFEEREQIVAFFKEQGFAYVTLDLEGYRTGSMNEVLPDAGRT
ncbi:MAG: ATP-dependent sacrificial sulfur transferase LarE [bacterium]